MKISTGALREIDDKITIEMAYAIAIGIVVVMVSLHFLLGW